MNLQQVSEIVWKQCLRVKPNERGLVVTDPGKMTIAKALFDAGKGLCNCSFIEMPMRKIHGEEPTKNVADMMLQSDVVIAPTSFSLTHTKATRHATERGVRIATLPNIHTETFLRAIPLDYEKLKKDAEEMVSELIQNGAMKRGNIIQMTLAEESQNR